MQVLKECNILDSSRTLVVGMSGGPDSTALLHILCMIPSNVCPRIVAAHLNHGWRGRQADRDERCAQKTARDLALTCVTQRLARVRGPVRFRTEAGGRQCRLDFFLELCQTTHADAVLTAHHMDDQAETVLMHILRGTGPNGLAGMRVSTQMGELRLIRPLLGISRREIISFLKSRRIPYVTDSTNQSVRYLRNKIRHKLIPFLESRFRKDVKKLLSHLADTSAEQSECMEEYANHAWRNVFIERSKDEVVFDFGKLSGEHPAIRQRVLRRAVRELGGQTHIDFYHVKRIQPLFLTGSAGPKVVEIPSGICVYRERERLIVRANSSVNCSETGPYEYTLSACCDLPVEEASITIALRQIGRQQAARVMNGAAHDRWHEVIDGHSLKWPLQVRNRRAGDLFHPLGQSRAMKLKDFFIREHVSVSQKQRWPLLVSDREIVWVPGYRISEAVRVTPQTAHFVELTANHL